MTRIKKKFKESFQLLHKTQVFCAVIETDFRNTELQNKSKIITENLLLLFSSFNLGIYQKSTRNSCEKGERYKKIMELND